MRPISQQVLELTDTQAGMSTREIVDLVWPVRKNGQLQQLLTKARSALVVHQKHGRVRQVGFAHGSYNNSRSIVWKITPEGRAWLIENDPVRTARQRADARAVTAERMIREENCEKLLNAARAEYGPETLPSVRREVSRLLRAEGCTLSSIAEIFGVTRELIRLDCKDLSENHKLSDAERAEMGLV